IDPDRRRERLVQKVFNDVVHHLHDDYRKDWDHSKRQLATDPDMFQRRASNNERELIATELRDEQEVRIKQLIALRDAGRLSEADFLLLVGTQVYGQTLANHAHDCGLNYEAVKKRHQRAMKAIGEFPPYGK